MERPQFGFEQSITSPLIFIKARELHGSHRRRVSNDYENATARAKGLNQSVVKEDTPQLRGMIRAVQFLLDVEETEE